MNTAVKVLNQARFHPAVDSTYFHSTRLKRINMALLIVLLLSAFAVIYVKDLNRRTFIQFQTLQTTHEKLYEDWGKLLLEQSTWSTQSRVQKIAAHRLGMVIPSPKEVVVLRTKN